MLVSAATTRTLLQNRLAGNPAGPKPTVADPTDLFVAGTAGPSQKVDLSGTIDETNWAPQQLKDHFSHMITELFDYVYSVPPAVSMYGTSRKIKPGSHEEELCQWVGYQLADRNIPVQTGGGDGVMSNVLEAYKERRGETAEVDGLDLRTQAINIKLPWEQKLNPHVESSHEVQSSIGLLYRELGIYLNSVGLGVLTGGIGTVNELFDLWARRLDGQHQDPIAVDATFWGPLLKATKASMANRGLITHQEWREIDLSIDRHQAITRLDPKGGQNEKEETAEQLIHGIHSCIDGLNEASAPMVTFIGSQRLKADDPTCETAAQLASALASEGIPMKLGSGGAMAKAVTVAAGPEAEIQSYLLPDEEAPELPGRVVQDAITKQMALSLRSKAVVALPGDVKSVADLLSILTLAYVEAVPKQPIVLVGKGYWTPILKELKQTMLNDEFPTASKSVLERITITDDPKKALVAITEFKRA